MKISIDTLQLGDKQIKKIFMANDNGMQVECLSLGGIITKIMVPDREGVAENVVLGYDNLEDYIENPPYFGALIGRSSGRIHQGKITINGHTYDLGKGEGHNGHTLHGGVCGFDKKVWDVEAFEEMERVGVHLHYRSEDGEEGFPGCVHVTVTYSLTEDNTFEIAYYGTSDQDTLLNMTNHSYFNLSGNAKRKVTEQVLFVDSDYVTELDTENIATGTLVNVEEQTSLNFKEEKLIGRDIEDSYLKPQRGYDHAWKLNKKESVDAAIKDSASGRKMTVITTAEGVVIYSLNFPEDIVLDNGKVMGQNDGICFETQSLPIGYNECFKESSLLRAGETFKSSTQFKFSVE